MMNSQLNVEGTTLSTGPAGINGFTSLSDVVTALQSDANYAAAPFTIDISRWFKNAGHL